MRGLLSWRTLIVAVVVAVIIAIALTYILPARATDDIRADAGRDRGEQLCGGCHAVGLARGTDIAPSFLSIARSRSDDWVRGFLAHPHTPTMKGVDLTTREIDDIVAYLRRLRG
jgi:mono/diheme cytochrome c family protein